MATAKNNKKGKKINTTIKKVINSEVKEIKKETKKNYNLGWLWVLIGIVLPPVGIILYFILILVMDFEYTIPVAIITFIILFKHRNNIKRICQRQEKIFKM